MRGHRLSVEDQQEISQQYAAGIKPKVIEASFRISKACLYDVLRRTDTTLRGMGKGPSHPCWKGGEHVNPDGMVEVWIADDHPLVAMRKADGYVLKHRLVMAESLGRPLYAHETVHHEDNDRLHNDLDNLQLRIGNHGPGVVLQCRSCGSIDLEPRAI